MTAYGTLRAWMSSVLLLISAAVTATALAAAPPPPEGEPETPCPDQFHSPDPARVGAWETVVPERTGAARGAILGMQSVHAVLLPSGKVLLAAGSSWRNRGPVESYPTNRAPAPGKGSFNRYDDPFRVEKLGEYYRVVNNTALYDPEANTFFRIPSPRPVPDPDAPRSFAPNDLFCTGHLQLPDGNPLLAGGTEYYYPYRTGLKSTFLFDWKKELGIDWAGVDWSRIPVSANDPWVFAGFMERGRWYPHMVPLLDGRLALFGGFVGFDAGYPVPYQFEINPYVELFDSYGFDPKNPQAAWKALDARNLEHSPFTTPIEPVCADPPCGSLCGKLEGRDRTQLAQCIERCRRDTHFDTFKLYPNNYLLPDGRIYLTREGEWVSARTDDTAFMRRTRHTYFARIEDSSGAPTLEFSPGPDRREPVTSYGTTFLDPVSGNISLLGGQKASAGTLLPLNSEAPSRFAGGRGSRKLETYELPKAGDGLGQWFQDDDFLGTEAQDDRTMHYAVLLPTRQVLVINGGNYDFYGPIHYPVLLTPPEDGADFGAYRIERMADAVQARLYHNVAMLLPDARVLVAGGNIARATFRLDGPPTVRNPFNARHPYPNVDLVDLDMYFFRDGQMGRFQRGMLKVPTETWVAEIFSPPYLFIDGDRRARILRLGRDEGIYGGPFATEIEGHTYYLLRSRGVYEAELDGLPTACGEDQEASLVLAKLPAATHGWDSGQRLVPLSFQPLPGAPSRIRFTMPDRVADNVPPAYYMLFYVDCHGKPSKAQLVRFDDHATSP